MLELYDMLARLFSHRLHGNGDFWCFLLNKMILFKILHDFCQIELQGTWEYVQDLKKGSCKEIPGCLASLYLQPAYIWLELQNSVICILVALFAL